MAQYIVVFFPIWDGFGIISLHIYDPSGSNPRSIWEQSDSILIIFRPPWDAFGGRGGTIPFPCEVLGPHGTQGRWKVGGKPRVHGRAHSGTQGLGGFL